MEPKIAALQNVLASLDDLEKSISGEAIDTPNILSTKLNEVIVSLGTAYEEGRTMDAYSNFQLPVELFSHIDQYSESIHPDSYLSNAQSDCQQKLKEMTSKLSSLDFIQSTVIRGTRLKVYGDKEDTTRATEA